MNAIITVAIRGKVKRNPNAIAWKIARAGYSLIPVVIAGDT
jgi:hypothetical protein